MKFKGETDRYGYVVLYGSELQRWNLKFLVHHNEKVVTFCATDFYVKKVVNYDNMFIVLGVIASAWTMEELERQIRWRAPHLGMDDDDFFKVNKSYKSELDRIKRQSYYVGEAPENYLTDEIVKEMQEKEWIKLRHIEDNATTLLDLKKYFNSVKIEVDKEIPEDYNVIIITGLGEKK